MVHEIGTELIGLFRRHVPLKGRFPRERRVPDTEDAIRLYRGDTFKFTVQIFDEKGVPLDLTGATLISTWKEQDCFDEIIFQITETTGITVTDANNGKFILVVNPTVTSQLETIDYVFDVEVTLSDGTIGTILKRMVEILTDVTTHTE